MLLSVPLAYICQDRWFCFLRSGIHHFLHPVSTGLSLLHMNQNSFFPLPMCQFQPNLKKKKKKHPCLSSGGNEIEWIVKKNLIKKHSTRETKTFMKGLCSEDSILSILWPWHPHPPVQGITTVEVKSFMHEYTCIRKVCKKSSQERKGYNLYIQANASTYIMTTGARATPLENRYFTQKNATT